MVTSKLIDYIQECFLLNQPKYTSGYTNKTKFKGRIKVKIALYHFLHCTSISKNLEDITISQLRKQYLIGVNAIFLHAIRIDKNGPNNI